MRVFVPFLLYTSLLSKLVPASDAQQNSATDDDADDDDDYDYNDALSDEEANDRQKVSINSEDCGVDGNSVITKRILNGSSAADHMFPWTVKLYRVDEKGKLGLCTGSLISDRHVLTAAHCVYGHDGYTREGLLRDIALLTLSKPVRYGTSLRPVCLPEPRMGDYAWEYALVAGHGVAGYKGSGKGMKPKFPNTLQYTEVEVQSELRCSLMWARYGQFNPDYQLCARKGYQGPCGGDSGGPLMHRSGSSSRMYVIGITSYVKGRSSTKCLTKYGGVFVRVSAYYEWIMKSLHHDQGWVPARCETRRKNDSCKLYDKILQLLDMY